MSKKSTRFSTDDDYNQNNQTLSRQELFDIYSSFGDGSVPAQNQGQDLQNDTNSSEANGFVIGQNNNGTDAVPSQTHSGFSTVQGEAPYERAPGLSFNSAVEGNDQINPAKKIIYVHKERATAKIYALLAVAVCIGFVAISVVLSVNAAKKRAVTNNSGDSFIESVNSTVDAQEYIQQMFGNDNFDASGKKTSTTTTENKADVDPATAMASIAEPTELKIVNSENPLEASYKPNVKGISMPCAKSGVRLEPSAAQALAIMYKSMKDDGVTAEFRAYSGYRSYAVQKAEYKALTKSLRKDMGVKNTNVANDSAAQILGKAGTSEHQLGTSIDFCVGENLGQDFLSTDAGHWLLKNSYKYGYVLRYPADKLNIHKRTYEPWHFRYVGVTAAKKMYENNLCLEEYAALNG